MGKEDETTPLLPAKNDSNYSTVNIEAEGRTTSLKELFVCVTTKDKCLLTAGTIAGLLGSCLFPLTWLSSQIAFKGAAPYEQLSRSLINNGVLSDENQTELLDAGQYYIDMVTMATLLVTVCSLLHMALKFTHLYLFGVVAVRTTRRLRYRYMAHVLSMDIGASQQRTTGQLTTSFDDDALENNLPQAIGASSTVLASFITCLSIRWDMSLIMLCFIVPALLLFYTGTKHYTKMVGIEQGLFANAAEIANESFMCIKTVICFNGQQQTINKYNDTVSEAMRVSKQRTLRISLIDAAKVLITDSLMLVSVIYGATYINDTEPFLLITVLILGMELSNYIPMLNMHINAVFVAVASAQQINRILAVTPEIELLDEGEFPLEIGPKISFEHVSFSYPSRPDVQVLKDFNLSIHPGHRIAIVGQSGCGKSTIAALLMRFFDPTSGVITLDGKPITSLNVSWLRTQFGFVAQQPVLFDMSIYENLNCCKSNASGGEIINALDQASAMQFVSEMAQGVETRVGERGSQLSGGERQRVAIARALLRRPPVLIFDEATSSLDSQNEALVQRAIDELSKSHTTITIAHRLSTILNADQIIVMEQGKVLESGSPKALIEKGEIFYHMLQRQRILVDARSVFSQSDTSDSEAPREQNIQKSRRLKNFVGQLHVVQSNNDMTREQNMETVSTKSSLKYLMSLHPNSKRSLLISTAAAFIKGGRIIAFMVIMLINFDAFTYDTNVMVKRVYHMAPVFALVIIVSFVSEIVLTKEVGRFADELTAKLRNFIITHFLRQNLEYFDMSRHESGSLSASLTTHPANIRETLTNKLPELLTGVLMALQAAVLTLAVNVRLSLIAFSLTAVSTLLRLIESRSLLRENKRLLPLQSKAAALASEAFTNLETLKAYGLENYFTELYKQRYALVEKQKIRRVFFNCILIASAHGTQIIAGSITFLIGAHMMVANQSAPLLDIYICSWINTIVFSRLLMLLSQARMITRALTSCNVVARISKEPTKTDNLTASGLKTEIEGQITFENVTFGYPAREAMLFNKLNLQLEKSKTVAIVGPSGSGKTTILQLILRLYDSNSGVVKIDKINVAAFNPRHLRNKIVPVNQDPVLFSGSIWDNITYGVDCHLATPERVHAAARDANIHDFIISLPQVPGWRKLTVLNVLLKGYQTNVGQLGARLSGGEKQRISIARALIRQPKVLLLDEASAALDSANEALVQAALDKAKHQRTCITIAHRLATIKNSDLIIVVSDGKIFEKGTHDELMRHKGLYHHMCKRQETIEE